MTKPLPARLDNAPLDYAPENELGVVYLFSHLARKRFGLRVRAIQAGFPDCLAVDAAGRKVRIEFEFKARNFLRHGHDPKGCDRIVCWINDWPGAPEHLVIHELRREFGKGFSVWIQPIGGEWAQELHRTNRGSAWTVSSLASEGDLVLFYHTRPECCIRDVFRITGPVRVQRRAWKPGMDSMAPIRRVCTLRDPIHLHDVRQHPRLKTASFVRGSMMGRPNASQHWPDLYQMILARNPSVAAMLANFGPDRLG